MAALPPQVPLIDEAGVRLCLGVCGLTQAGQVNGWIDEGMATMEDILAFRPSEIYDVGANLQKLPVNRGGSRQGRAQLRKIEALVRWCLQRRSSGETLDAREFTHQVMMEMVEQIRVEKDEEDGTEEKPPESVKFKPSKWVSWKLAFEEQISQIVSITDNLPLSYVIRSETPPDAAALAAMNPDERRFWTTNLRGPRYQRDNHKVFSKLKYALVDTEAWTWIQTQDTTKDGRAAWKALLEHYDGPSQTEKRIATAKATLKTLHYRSEKHAINFDVYVTKMHEALTTLEENGVIFQPFQWVDYLLDGIDPNANQAVQTAKSIIRFSDTLKVNFTLASNKMSEFITKEVPALEQQGPRGGGGRRVAAFTRGGGRSDYGGRGRGRGGRGRGRGGGRNGGRGNPYDTRLTVGGVDVSDPHKDFTSSEWAVLREQKYIDTLKARRKKAKHDGSTVSTESNSVSLSSIKSDNEQLRARLAALEGILNAQETNQSSDTSNSSKKTPNGVNFGSGAYAQNGNKSHKRKNSD